LLIEILRRLIAPFTSFDTPNAVHATFSIGTSPAADKTQSFVDYDENINFVTDGDIATFNAPFNPFCTPNVLHANFSIGRGPATRKTQTFVDYCEISNFDPD
jgi:hypothetical protein